MDIPETLDSLLTRCHIGRYMHGIWFNGAVLNGTVLSVAEEDIRGFVERQWGAEFRQHIPELVIRVKTSRDTALAKTKPSIYNKRGQAYQKARLGGMD